MHTCRRFAKGLWGHNITFQRETLRLSNTSHQKRFFYFSCLQICQTSLLQRFFWKQTSASEWIIHCYAHCGERLPDSSDTSVNEARQKSVLSADIRQAKCTELVALCCGSGTRQRRRQSVVQCPRENSPPPPNLALWNCLNLPSADLLEHSVCICLQRACTSLIPRSLFFLCITASLSSYSSGASLDLNSVGKRITPRRTRMGDEGRIHGRK